MIPQMRASALALCCLCVVLVPLAGGFLVNIPHRMPVAPQATTSGERHRATGHRNVGDAGAMRCGVVSAEMTLGRRDGRICSGMARLRMSTIMSSSVETGEGSKDSAVPSSVPETGGDHQQQEEDPLKLLERQMLKEGGNKKKPKRHANDYRKEGDWSKRKNRAGENDSQLNVAFSAFCDTLLRPGQGRVRFSTIMSTFRDEFPTLAPESRISNHTLGRKLQAWYAEKTGGELKREPGGPYSGLSIVNPRFTSVDLTSLRAAQALFEPDMKKKFEKLGLPLHTNTEGKKQFERRMSKRKDRSKQEQRVVVHKNSKGKVIRVVRRADPEKGVKEKVLSGRRMEDTPSRVDQLRKVGPAARVCITSFCSTQLVNEGTSSFSDVKGAFLAHFPLLSSSDRMTDSFFGRVVSDWYRDKYGVPLKRTKTKEMVALNMSRAQVPFSDLSIRPPSESGDLTLLNEAKVALRRALEMEGVGVLVKRDAASGAYKVALIAQGSPACKEGSIQVGDTIISIGSQPASDMDVQQLADAVLGRRGTKVKLTLGRLSSEGELQVFTVFLKRRDEQTIAPPPPPPA